MSQLYFLSIVLTGLTGFLFVFGETEEKDSIEKSMKFSFFGGGFRLILGILTAIVGFVKLFLPYRSYGASAVAGVPILGDLFPALGGIAGGFILLFGFYREHSSGFDKESNLDRIGDAFLLRKKITGFVLIGIALLHFLFGGNAIFI